MSHSSCINKWDNSLPRRGQPVPPADASAMLPYQVKHCPVTISSIKSNPRTYLNLECCYSFGFPFILRAWGNESCRGKVPVLLCENAQSELSNTQTSHTDNFPFIAVTPGLEINQVKTWAWTNLKTNIFKVCTLPAWRGMWDLLGWHRTEIYAVIFCFKTFAGRWRAKRVPLFADNFLLKEGKGGSEDVDWSKKKIHFSPGFWGWSQMVTKENCHCVLCAAAWAGNPWFSALICASLTLQ